MKDLQQLIERLNKIVSAKEEWSTLQEKRDELDQILGTLYEELQELMISLHKKGAESSENLHLRIKGKQELVDSFKKKKKELDSFLDEIEDHSEEQIDELQKQIVYKILGAYPEQRNFYEALCLEIKRVNELERESRTIKGILHQLSVHLDEIANIRNQVKRRGILSYVFGPNPNGMITLHLLGLKKEMESAFPHLESVAANTAGGDELREIYAEMIVFFSELKTQTEEQWGFKKLDAMVSKAIARTNDLDRFFTTLCNQSEEEGEKLEKKFTLWMNKFSGPN